MACCDGIKKLITDLMTAVFNLKNVYVAYADDIDGNGFSLIQDGTKEFIQFINVNTALNPPTAGDFTGVWKDYVGNDGAPGAPGTPGLIQSVSGLNTDNSDPANPIVKISVDGVTITGDGTPGNPLVSAVIVPKLGQFQFNADPTIPGSGNLIMDWSSVIFDNGNYNDISDPTKKLIDTTGFYRITCNGNVSPSGNELWVFKNGNFLPIHESTQKGSANFSRIFAFNAGDYFQVQITQATPGQFVDFRLWSPFLEIERVG